MSINIGWSSCEIIPEQPVFVCGQFPVRVSEGVLDPVTANILAFESDESDSGGVILVSCDLVGISEGLRETVRRFATQLLPEIKPENIILNATHTHTAPDPYTTEESITANPDKDSIPVLLEMERDVMDPEDYLKWVSARISKAIEQAWNSRKPGGIGYGFGHAVVGHNRMVSYYNGKSQMYGIVDDPEFSHIEGYEDHSVNVLYTWDTENKLTGLVVNIPCPSQDDEGLYVLSADYWNDVRIELRKRLGPDIHILPQASAAGDQSPHLLLNRAAEQRMWRLMGRTHRQDLAMRISDAVTGIMPYIEKEIDWQPVFKHVAETIDLPRRLLTTKDVDGANAEAEISREAYQQLIAEYRANPEKYQPKEWHAQMTAQYRLMKWNEGVADRYALEQKEPTIPIEVHALRIGDIAMGFNQFEYYLDFGTQIKAHSKAIQTFIVQLAGPSSYLPSERTIAGSSYGANAASSLAGPEGGRQLANWTAETINGMFWG